MYAYNFTIDGQTFHYVGETSVKLNIIDKQGKETLQKLNNDIKKKYEDKAVNSERVLYGGTVLDSDKNVISGPEVVQVQKRQKSDNAIRYKIIDGTFINIYSINDHTLLGTRNSWGINKSVDIYEDFSYGDAFNECLEHYGITLEDMPHGTYAFSNPKIHLLAKELRIYSFVNDELNDKSMSFDLADTDEEYIEYYPETKTFYENISINRKHLVELLYYNRKKFRSRKDNNISLINCITYYQCFAKKSVRKYVNDNKVFNEYSLGCYRYIMGVVRQLSKIHSDSIKFYGIPLPKGMQIHKPTNLSPKYLSFWYEVLSNAYNNSLNKGLPTFKPIFGKIEQN